MTQVTRISASITPLGRRRGLCAGFAALALTLFAQSATAADLSDTLRGPFSPDGSPPSYTNWTGVYFGAQLGASSANVNYANSLSSLTEFIVRESIFSDTVPKWITMGKESVSHFNYGAFLGYNFYQWDDVVLGFEANYSRIDASSQMSDSLSRIINNDSQAPSGHHYYYHLTVAGLASLHVTDVATLRMRAGWSTGQFLPYVFGGMAIGRANYYRSAYVSYWTEDKPDTTTPATTPNPPPNFNYPPGSDPTGSQTEAQSNAIAYGFTTGLGVDVALLPNMFLRAEWEYVQFAPIHDIQLNINSARVALGLKF
jgi:outer membrane immunogenic protein